MRRFGVTQVLSSIAGQSLAAVAATIVAGIAVFAVSGAPEASAPQDFSPAVATGTACSSRGWPAFEEKCQFDLRQPGHEARVVRIIAIR
jgi:hypothetical protein